jgi:hypothetical protein
MNRKGEKGEEDTRIRTRKRVSGKKAAWCKALKKSQYEASASGRRKKQGNIQVFRPFFAFCAFVVFSLYMNF